MTDTVVTVNLDGVVASLNQAIQRAINMVAFGLRAATNLQPPFGQYMGLELPGVLMQLVVTQNPPLAFDMVRDQFARWILANGMRECTEALGSLFEEARKVGTLIKLGPRFPADRWYTEVLGQQEKFDRLHLPDKVKFLTDLCGPTLVPESMEQVSSVNLARNCLVHRGGIVGKRDLNQPDGLLVQWLKLQFVTTNLDGETRIVQELPCTLEAGEAIGVRQQEQSKLFRMGESINFTAQEFSDICWTMLRFGQQLVGNLHKLMVDKGISQPSSEADAVE